MSSTAIIPFDSTPAPGSAVAVVPEHLVALFGDSANITPRFSINQLSYRGKVWRRVVEGEETVLTRPSQDNPGDVEPIPLVNLVILDHNKSRSRAYYEGAFEEGKNSSPRCYSGDGVAPDATVKEPCAATCATCPNAVKGSKITENGKQTTLCSPFKRVAVVPSANIGQHPAMLLRLAQTSVWDKDNGENEAKGWYAWDQYLDMLRARGAKHTAVVETRVKFDSRMAYPKLLFSASRWMNPDEASQIKQLLADKEKDIADILSGTPDRDGVAGHPAAAPTAGVDPTVSAVNVAAAAVQKAAAPAPQPTPAPTAAPAAAKPAGPKKPPAPTQAPVVMETVKTIDMTKTEGFTLEQMIEAGWTEEGLVAEGMLTITQKPVAAAAPKGPKKPPAAPAGPKKPPAAAAPAEDSGSADAFAAAAAPTQAAAPAPAAQSAGAATVVTDTPAGLSDLLNGWDDGDGA